MSRSPLAYPLTRGVDGDSGGAADLQTDIMRFMAILSLCLVAIFALVQSLPIEAQTPSEATSIAVPQPIEEPAAVAEEVTIETTQLTREASAVPVEPEPVDSVALTRPKWVSTFQPAEKATTPPPQPPAAAEPKLEPEDKVFTLRFESDNALTRLVATGQVAFYAIDADRAQRMTVSDSRISFWDASTPNTFHEMEASTVPQPVVDALLRSGANATGVEWGVTLPGKLSTQLNSLMQQHQGGALVIHADGNLKLEQS